MKLFLIFIISFYANFTFGQVLKVRILDVDSKQPLEGVTVFLKQSRFTSFTDVNGEFFVNIKSINVRDSIVLSSIGHHEKVIAISDIKKSSGDTLELISKPQQLEEIVISSGKIDYSWAKTINSKRKPSAGFSFQFGTENIRFVQNSNVKKGKIKKVILSLEKHRKNRDIPKWKMDYITAYNIKFYKYDARNQRPGEELYDKNIIIEPENKTYDFAIDVDSLNIPFPKEGVCVGVEYINIRYENPKTTFASIGPVMNFYEEEKLKPILAWSRYRGIDWEFKSSISNFKNRRYQNVMVVDLVVNTEK